MCGWGIKVLLTSNDMGSRLVPTSGIKVSRYLPNNGISPNSFGYLYLSLSLPINLLVMIYRQLKNYIKNEFLSSGLVLSVNYSITAVEI